jgi:hypothetical protein
MSKRSKALMVVKRGHLTQYSKMCTAIALCASFDECKDIIDKSVAMAAYYKQIKDTETEVMFYRVRLRAWRRIGELFATVDLSSIPPTKHHLQKGEGGMPPWVTQTSKVRKIRASFPDDPTVADMTDNRISEILKLMEVSDKDFEYAVKQQVGGTIVDLMRRTPTAEAEREKAEKERAAYHKRSEKKRLEEEAKSREKIAAALERNALEAKHINELDRSASEAMKEVGITLERKDRANMKQVVFLIKDEVHEALRQAAFDKKITMQDVLRRGLRLWLEANGYDWPDGNNNDGTRGYRNNEARP